MQGQEVQGILGIGNYQARARDITDCTECRNLKIAYHSNIFKINMKSGSNLTKICKAFEVNESYS